MTTSIEAVPKLFSPLTLRGCVARNRIVISPMSTSSASLRGLAQPWHIAHLSKFALGGAGIVFVEATAVDPRGRVTYSDLGLWSEEHAEALRPVVESIRTNGALAGIQIAHAGRRGASQKPWEGKGPLTELDTKRGEPPWPLWGPSPVAAREGCQVPLAMTHAMIDEVQEAFMRSAALADQAGFDVLELHGGHGYLIHAFLSPIANRRTGYANLVFHIFNIAECFLEHDEGIGLTYEAYNRVIHPGIKTTAALLAYARDVQNRTAQWTAMGGRTANWGAKADVYYGDQTLHQFLERTTWHASQHT